jgi:DNA-binding NarL/FixJ family response regulator
MHEGRSLAGLHVLVVEDQYLLARDVAEWLEDAGAHVVGPVPDSKQACHLIDHEDLKAAVVDINLGQGPAYEVASKLAERSVPFLFATGYDRAAIPDEFINTPRLEKPFKGADLVEALKALPLERA